MGASVHNEDAVRNNTDYEDDLTLRYFSDVVLAPDTFKKNIPRAALPHNVNQLDQDTTLSQSTGSQSSPLVFVFVPILSVFILIVLIFAAHRTWKRYRHTIRHQQNHHCPVDTEQNYEEQELLRPNTGKVMRNLEARVIQETELKLDSRSDCVDGPREEITPLPTQKTISINSIDKIVGSDKVNKIDNADNTVQKIEVEEEKRNEDEEEAKERPKTLKFLAASVAFQFSTVPATKRIPYTPDPDCILSDGQNCVEPPSPISEESVDKVAPLSFTPRSRMIKSKCGLLERRGSSVALTICLQKSEELKSGRSTSVSSAKSPKPRAYLQRASSLLTPTELYAKSLDTVRLQQEFWEIPMNHPSEKDFNVAGHGTKNRYRSILPNDHSRVKLPALPDEDTLSSYINANYIRDCTSIPGPLPQKEEFVATPVTKENAAFIATQGPMANTVVDFWRMIWNDDVETIVMITKLKERKEKCTQYLPVAVDETETYEDFSAKVTNLRHFEHFSVRTLELTHGEKSRTLKHYWYTTWMDHETPEKTRGLLELVQEVSLQGASGRAGPMVVHCSAGIGRTGCYIAVTVGCRQLNKTGKTDILRIVSQMRLDRGGMIQTWEQYQFVHQALSRYARILAGENVTTPSTTGSVRSPPGPASQGSLPRDPSQDDEPTRPRTPKQSRSFSEANLPSSKEVKLNTRHSNAAPSCNKPATSKRRSKFRSLHSPLDVSSHPLPDGLPSPQSDAIKALSSPKIKSPFGRLCLQTKDLNAGPSPVHTGRFEWPESHHLPYSSPIENGWTVKDEVASNMTENKVLTSDRNSASLVGGSPLSSNVEFKVPRAVPSQRQQFIFDLPKITSAAESVKPETNDNATMPILTIEKNFRSTGTSEKRSNPSAKTNSRFVFPMPKKD